MVHVKTKVQLVDFLTKSRDEVVAEKFNFLCSLMALFMIYAVPSGDVPLQILLHKLRKIGSNEETTRDHRAIYEELKRIFLCDLVIFIFYQGVSCIIGFGQLIFSCIL